MGTHACDRTLVQNWGVLRCAAAETGGLLRAVAAALEVGGPVVAAGGRPGPVCLVPTWRVDGGDGRRVGGQGPRRLGAAHQFYPPDSAICLFASVCSPYPVRTLLSEAGVSQPGNVGDGLSAGQFMYDKS